MAKCQFCDKDVAFGIQVSHSHRRSNRTWKPNVKRVKAIVDGRRNAQACLCLHSLPAQRKGHPRCVIEHYPIKPVVEISATGFFGFREKNAPPALRAENGKASKSRRSFFGNTVKTEGNTWKRWRNAF